MNQICTGNPDQRWEYDEPNEDGTNNHVIMSEREIFDVYFSRWAEMMMNIGKQELSTRENCIDEWIIVNWASKVE